MFVSGFDEDEQEGIEPPNNPDEPGERLLQATEDGNLEVVQQLLSDDQSLVSYKDADGYTALHRACYENNHQIATLLLSHGASVDAISNEGWTPLHSACHWNASSCTRLLLENGANVNAQTNGKLTPLHLACNNGGARETLIVLLMEPGINTDMGSNAEETPNEIARRSGNLDHLFEIHRKSIKLI